MNRAVLREWLHQSRLSTHARLVYVALTIHADPAGEAWPSISTLARETGAGRTTVKESLRELAAVGDVNPKFRPGHSTVYLLTDPAVWRLGNGSTRSPGDPHPVGNGAEPGRLATPEGFEGFKEGARLDPSVVDNNLGGVGAARDALREARAQERKKP